MKKHIIKFRVDDEEYSLLQQKFKLSECSSMSSFLRKISLGGAIYIIDMSEFTQMRKLIQSISNNINQIALRVNSQGSIYKEDIEEIQSKVNEIWQQQVSMQSLLRKLEH